MPHPTIQTLLLFLVCTMAMTVPAAEAQRLSGSWQFHENNSGSKQPPPGDSPGWHDVAVPGMLNQQHGQSISGWYRLRFDRDSVAGDRTPKALLIEQLRHADDTRLNGVRIGAEGRFESPWEFSATNPQAAQRVYPIPPGLLRARNNELLIRTVTGFGPAWGALFPGGAGIIDGDIRIDPLDDLSAKQRQTQLTGSILDSVFITLGIVDVLLILLLLRRSQQIFPEFKWLLITSLLMLLGASGHDVFYLTGLNIHANFLMAVAMLGVPPSIALYFHAQHRNIPRTLLRTLALIWGISSLTLLLPWPDNGLKTAAWYLFNGIALASFAYAVACAVSGVHQKRVAAWPQLLAIVVYILSIRTQWLPEVYFGHRNIQIGSLFYRYALLYAYILRLQQMQTDYRALSRRVVGMADAIHAKLSRELHDGIGQSLSAIKLRTQLALQSTPSRQLSTIRDELDQAIVDFRRILGGLHPLQLDQRGLHAALRDEASHLESLHPGLCITLEVDPAGTLDRETELHLFRIFQEAVHNAIRHGKARHITVSLKQEGSQAEFRIHDDGQGFGRIQQGTNRKSQGLGLVSLRERAAMMGGQFAIDTHPGEGTRITVHMPLGR